MYIKTLNNLYDYLDAYVFTKQARINVSIQNLYITNCVSYPQTQDKKINRKDLESLQTLLNIKFTHIKTTSDHNSIYGPFRPTNFPANLQNYQFTDLELFLHELITDSNIAWLTNTPLSDLRDQTMDIKTFETLI